MAVNLQGVHSELQDSCQHHMKNSQSSSLYVIGWFSIIVQLTTNMYFVVFNYVTNFIPRCYTLLDIYI